MIPSPDCVEKQKLIRVKKKKQQHCLGEKASVLVPTKYENVFKAMRQKKGNLKVTAVPSKGKLNIRNVFV